MSITLHFTSVVLCRSTFISCLCFVPLLLPPSVILVESRFLWHQMQPLDENSLWGSDNKKEEMN